MDRKGRLIGILRATERTHEMAKGFATLDPMLHVCGHVHGNLVGHEFGRHPDFGCSNHSNFET